MHESARPGTPVSWEYRKNGFSETQEYGQLGHLSLPRVGLAAISALAAVGLACSGGSARGAQPQGPSGIPVKVETAKLISVNDTTEYVSTLKSRDTAVIMPQVEGHDHQHLCALGQPRLRWNAPDAN